MKERLVIHFEAIHDTGTERFKAAGPRVRLGEGGEGPCSLSGAAAGAWLELEASGETIRVLDSLYASMDGGPLMKGTEIPPGSVITIGNALVTVLAVSREETPREEAPVAPAPSEPAAPASEPAAEKPVGEKTPLAVSAPLPPSEKNERQEASDGGGDAHSTASREPESDAPLPPGLLIFDGNTPRRVPLMWGAVTLGSAADCSVIIEGKWVAERHAVLEPGRSGAEVKVLRGFDHTTIAGEFRRSGVLRDGEWLVMGEARVMLDMTGRGPGDVQPPPPVPLGASFSPLSAPRRTGTGAAALLRWAKASPALFFSVVFHLLILVALLYVTVKTEGESISISLTSRLEEEPAAEEQPEPEEELTFTEERTDEFNEFALEEFEDEIEETGKMGEGSDPLSGMGEGGGGGELPPIMPEQGLLPRRPPPRGAPTLVQLRRRGLDIVFLFDTTASMGWLLDDVKRSIKTIYDVTFDLVKSTRFACVAYRDVKPVEEYVTRTLAFTASLPELQHFLNRLDAAGGGDLEEAVQEGLKRITRLQWRRRAYKVVIMFADAPCHPQHRRFCLRWVRRFHQNHGYFHAVHVIRGTGSDEETREFLAAMAERGGGEMVPISQEATVLAEILKLVFGPSNRDAVKKAIQDYKRKRLEKKKD